jgi:hypothetical protein
MPVYQFIDERVYVLRLWPSFVITVLCIFYIKYIILNIEDVPSLLWALHHAWTTLTSTMLSAAFHAALTMTLSAMFAMLSAMLVMLATRSTLTTMRHILHIERRRNTRRCRPLHDLIARLMSLRRNGRD